MLHQALEDTLKVHYMEALLCPPAQDLLGTNTLLRLPTPTPDHRHRCMQIQEAAAQQGSPASAGGVSREELQAVLDAALQAMQRQVKLARHCP